VTVVGDCSRARTVVARGRGDRMLKLDGPTGRGHRRNQNRGQVVDANRDPTGRRGGAAPAEQSQPASARGTAPGTA
jgi:hypothetical protein